MSINSHLDTEQCFHLFENFFNHGINNLNTEFQQFTQALQERAKPMQNNLIWACCTAPFWPQYLGRVQYAWSFSISQHRILRKSSCFLLGFRTTWGQVHREERTASGPWQLRGSFCFLLVSHYFLNNEYRTFHFLECSHMLCSLLSHVIFFHLFLCWYCKIDIQDYIYFRYITL